MNSNGASRTAGTAGTPHRSPGVVTVAALALAAVMAASCAGSEPSQVATAPAQPPADPPPAPAQPPADPAPAAQEAADGNALPSVTVIDVVSGESLVLSSLAPADRPILAWFWAPH